MAVIDASDLLSRTIRSARVFGAKSHAQLADRHSAIAFAVTRFVRQSHQSQFVRIGAGQMARDGRDDYCQPDRRRLGSADCVGRRFDGQWMARRCACLVRDGTDRPGEPLADPLYPSFLLSPATSLIGGPGTPGARICLLGSPTPSLEARDGIDLESIQLTELVEFAFSLTPAIKGQEPFLGFAHLQSFRLYHATQLADSGNVGHAMK